MRLPMKVPRKSRTQNSKCLPPNLKSSIDDESFNSFYGKLNEIVIAKLNLGEKIEDAKVVRKFLRFLPESFHPKVRAIVESKDLDEIKI